MSKFDHVEVFAVSSKEEWEVVREYASSVGCASTDVWANYSDEAAIAVVDPKGHYLYGSENGGRLYYDGRYLEHRGDHGGHYPHAPVPFAESHLCQERIWYQ